MDSTKRSLQDSTVAVIGGAGFLGSQLVDYLIEEKGCRVVVLDNLISGQKRFVHKDAIFEWCDITQSESRLRKLFEYYNVEYVFNYAAMPYIPVSFERPLHVLDINARGALMVMNAAQLAGVKAILQVSSAEIYGDAQPDEKGISETTVPHPHSTYGASKLAIDNLIEIRWKEAKTPAISLRQFNCVGPRETHPYIVPEIIQQVQDIKEGKRAVIRLGNNSQRDFQWSGDAVRMAAELLEKGEFGEVYNMGSENSVFIYDLAEEIANLMEVTNVQVQQEESRVRPWEIWYLKSNNTKLYSVINWRPNSTLQSALASAVNWYYENGKKWDF